MLRCARTPRGPVRPCPATSPLLPQPGGFEGLLVGRVLPSSGDLAIAYRDQNRVANVDLGVTLLHSPDAAQKGNHLIAGLDQFLDLCPTRIERLLPPPVVLPHRVRAAHDADVIDVALDRSPFNVWVPELRNGIQPAAVVGREI